MYVLLLFLILIYIGRTPATECEERARGAGFSYIVRQQSQQVGFRDLTPKGREVHCLMRTGRTQSEQVRLCDRVRGTSTRCRVLVYSARIIPLIYRSYIHLLHLRYLTSPVESYIHVQ